MYTADKKAVLKQYFGYESFRDGQEWLIDHILAGRDVLGVMPTGAGKSICFQVPAMCFEGVTLVISPLISLMKDQVNTLTQSGVRAAYINSSLTPAQYAAALENARSGAYKIIYVAPERLLAQDFLSFALSAEISMVTVDEAHCISQWGQDFRPSYIKIVDFIEGLPSRPVVSAFTATATAQVREDISGALRLRDPQVLVTGFDRKNLYFEVQKPKDKFTALTDYLHDRPDRSGIVYCSTRKTVDEVCERLSSGGYSATRYHAGLTDRERKENQDDFIFDRRQIIVATNAFGMGIDKSNVSFVVHYNMPKDIESYYQEAGRAGRDGEPADCILFYSGQDVRTNLFLIDNGRESEAADIETEELLKERDRDRLKKMTFYCHTNECLREYILKYFGEAAPDHCGNCGSCNTQYRQVDITVGAQKILSCIARSGQKYGVKTIVDTLRGSKSERIIRLGLDRLSTYGIMKNDSEQQIRSMIQFLALNGCIRITNDKYPVATLGGEAHDVLFGGRALCMKLALGSENKAKPGKTAQADLKEVNRELLGKMKKLRAAIAAEQNVPAYIIFTDATLTDMCMRLPTDDEEFLGVSGVGRVKLERYGRQFIRLVADYLSAGTAAQGTAMLVSGEAAPAEICGYLQDRRDEIELYDRPVPVSVFTDQLNSVISQKFTRKIIAQKLADWLVENGYLCIETDGENNARKLPTEKGSLLGISSQPRVGRGGQSYMMNLYDAAAQQFLFDHIEDILPHVLTGPKQ